MTTNRFPFYLKANNALLSSIAYYESDESRLNYLSLGFDTGGLKMIGFYGEYTNSYKKIKGTFPTWCWYGTRFRYFIKHGSSRTLGPLDLTLHYLLLDTLKKIKYIQKANNSNQFDYCDYESYWSIILKSFLFVTMFTKLWLLC